MNKKLLDQLIDLYLEYYKNNAKEIIEERDNKKSYYQSYTKEKILNMTDDELKEYIERLWSVDEHNKSPIFKSNKPEVLKQEISNLLYGSDIIENRVKRFTSQTKALKKARITELLCCVYPNEYMICNSKTDRVFEKLGIKNDHNGNENGFNYTNYLKELEYGKKIKDEISLKLGHDIDLLESDYFYNFIYENVISKKEPKIKDFDKINHSPEEMEIMEDNSNEYNCSKYDENDFKKEVYFGLNVFNEISSLMDSKKNIIIEGPPGVGKTHCIKNIIYLREHCKCDDRIKMIQFHQSYSYEDFIMGYKPTKTGFELKGGIFYEFCKLAAADEGNYYFIIDEINRGNLSKIFGETLMLMEKEYRGKSIELPYSNSDDELESTKANISFSIPKNVYIIGLMNTADRSLATLEYALRRRFAFFDLKPAFDKEYEKDEENSFNAYVKEIGKYNNKFGKLIDKVKELNNEIAKDDALGEGCKIGHSYFSNLKEETVTDAKLLEIVKYEIIPTLKEYWFDADEKNKLNKWINELTGVIND